MSDCWGLYAFRILVSVAQEVVILFCLNFCAYSLKLFFLRIVRPHPDVFSDVALALV